MRSVEIANRNLMRDHAAESVTRKPAVEMKGRRFDLERWLAQVVEIQIDRVIWRRANRGRDTGKHGQRRAMDVTGGDQLHTRMAPDHSCQFAGIEQILTVHVPDAGLERWMVQEQKCRPIWCGDKRRFEPLQSWRIEFAMRFAVHAGIQQHQIYSADFNPLIERPERRGIGLWKCSAHQLA